jgi:hypothetical protein
MQCLIIGICYIYRVKLLKGHAFNIREKSRGVVDSAEQVHKNPKITDILTAVHSSAVRIEPYKKIFFSNTHNQHPFL